MAKQHGTLPGFNDMNNLHSKEDGNERKMNSFNFVSFLRRNAFVVLTLTAVIIGVSLGFWLRTFDMAAQEILYLSFPGELLMRVLQQMVLPLILSSLITGMSSLENKVYSKIGLRALVYYVVTTVTAAFTGIALASIIQPGKLSKISEMSSTENTDAQTVDSFLDLLRNMFPSNLVEACFKKYKTEYVATENQVVLNITECGNITETIPVPGSSDGLNILGLLVFCTAFGLALGSTGSKGQPLRDFFTCLNSAIMNLINIVIWYSPVGIIFLLAGQILKIDNLADISHGVAMYTLSVIVGLFIHSFVTLPLIYFITTWKNPFKFMLGLLQALTTAFGTSSSSATLPVTFYCMEENNKMDKQVTRFMLPIGATMNMDGAALYEAVAALFIAQVNNINFSIGQIIILSFIVTAASTGAAGIPQAGMVSMLIVLTSVGLPAEGISLLMLVDWLLDRLRTVTNVLGDCIGVGVVQHLSRHELQRQSPAE
ncbi:excitatory amino acid transporter 4-like [Periophthalmus magnuspinnatus]|uniref:excitatory amino acid transporter 4-like n=1 Tax=Periophthalmus magnuspinnatus TaxID=409849 RepID=UPI00145AC2D2|nr:excitatory amino acid transporter 4-like [Periophthalmus magnuspinnatus]